MVNKILSLLLYYLKSQLVKIRCLFEDNQFMLKYTFLQYTCFIGTKLSIFNMQDLIYWPCTSNLDYFGQLVSPLCIGCAFGCVNIGLCCPPPPHPSGT